MKKKIAGVVPVIVMFCCLVGCQAAPEEVKQSAKNYQKNEQIANVQVEYCGVDALEEEAEKILQMHPENMVLPEKLDFHYISEIADIELEYQSDFLEKKDEVASSFAIGKNNWTMLETAVENENVMMSENMQEKTLLNVGDNGFFCVILPGAYEQYIQEDTTSFVTMYDLQKTKIEGETCIFAGKEVSIESQLEYVEKWLKGLQEKLLEPDFSYQAEAVAVRQKPDGNQVLEIQVDKYYNGIPFDDCGGQTELNQNVATLKTIGTSFQMIMTNPNEISFFTTGQGTFQVKEKTVQQKFITPSSAVAIVEKELSGFRKMKIEDIQIIDTLEPIYDSSKTNANHAPAGGKVLAHPTYRFYVNREYEDIGIAGINESSRFYFIDVNMLTGEVSINLDMSVYE